MVFPPAPSFGWFFLWYVMLHVRVFLYDVHLWILPMEYHCNALSHGSPPVAWHWLRLCNGYVIPAKISRVYVVIFAIRAFSLCIAWNHNSTQLSRRTRDTGIEWDRTGVKRLFQKYAIFLSIRIPPTEMSPHQLWYDEILVNNSIWYVEVSQESIIFQSPQRHGGCEVLPYLHRS